MNIYILEDLFMNGTVCVKTVITGINAETYQDAMQQIIDNCKKHGHEVELQTEDDRTSFIIKQPQDSFLGVISYMSHTPLRFLGE